jgi:3-methylcrotonyl-CoA carboxylase alpha subunit
MFDKLLIANRGEIACRVIATCRRLGIQTVAVFSDADADARHVRWADEAYRLGPAPSAESYLRGDVIIAIAQQSKAQAIHPGYGFLSENFAFADAVVEAGLTFIGPSASAIKAMGLKDAAKALMEKAGVPVVPGYHGAEQDADALAARAEEIGYPVLIKARAGGGGKGMRLVDSADDFAAALQSARHEAQASFGDTHCLVEKFIQRPRHIEIQVLADAHGAVVHLFERDCSLQRRHQKVIEEAPAPGIPDRVRRKMGEAAVAAAKAIGYQGAGTVEFIADGSTELREDGFWFMEMNTRLQVEHPVTEAITGVDLVAQQIAVAAGEPLAFSQNALTITGHAIEARIYAEDASKGFLPAVGVIDHISPPPEATEFAPGVMRLDFGVTRGDHISPFYDPMIGKLIVHGSDRAVALRRMKKALRDMRLSGVTTNLAFLSALVQHEQFVAGQMDTGLIDRNLEQLTAIGSPPPEAALLAAIALLFPANTRDNPHNDPYNDPWANADGWRAWGATKRTISLNSGGVWQTVCVSKYDQNSFSDGENTLQLKSRDHTAWRYDFNGRITTVDVRTTNNAVTLYIKNENPITFVQNDPLTKKTRESGAGDIITAPMPGLLKDLTATVGAAVASGDALAVLEAMKMAHTLVAPRDGVIASVNAKIGEQVISGAELIRLEPVND